MLSTVYIVHFAWWFRERCGVSAVQGVQRVAWFIVYSRPSDSLREEGCTYQWRNDKVGHAWWLMRGHQAGHG
jgi:hypothetical protein